MFTGIVAELGTVAAVGRGQDSMRLTIEAAVAAELEPGASVSVDGVCLTAAEISPAAFTADVMGETLERTTLGGLATGQRVNLELAVTPTGRLGGHIVQGHVDGVGRLLSRRSGADWDTVEIELPSGLARYVVEKGSITISGVSLTVAGVSGATVTIGLIPETLARTTLGRLAPGDPVNVEVDVLAKYIERMLVDHAERMLAEQTDRMLASYAAGIRATDPAASAAAGSGLSVEDAQ
jgi:riboflavin synthase